MPDPDAHEAALGRVAAVAGSICTALGEDAEIQPGDRDPDDAGQVNRADRAAASALLGLDAAPGTDLASQCRLS